MPTNRLSRSVPFWVLVGGSVVAIAGGAVLLFTKLDTMATKLTDGSATGVEVYAGQIWAVLGAILVGAGLIGLALALVLGALRSLAAPAAVDVVEPIAWEEEAVVTASEPLAPVAEPAAPVAEPVAEPAVAAEPVAPAATHAEPAIATGDEPAEPETPRA